MSVLLNVNLKQYEMAYPPIFLLALDAFIMNLPNNKLRNHDSCNTN